MLDQVDHNCGIAAVYVKNPKAFQEGDYSRLGNGEDYKHKASLLMYKLLLNLQNRGQLSAGVTSYDNDRSQLLQRHRKIGSVNEAFATSSKTKSQSVFNKIAGSKLIGHTRYATCGKDDVSYAQPFIRQHSRKWKWFSFCFNGNIANFTELKNKLVKETDYHIVRDTDTEIIQHYIAKELVGDKKPDLVDVFSNISKQFDGAWSLAYLSADGDLIVARDPHGFRPVCYVDNKDILVVASESNALINSGFKDIKYLDPGHMIIVTNGKVEVKKFAESPKISRCMFEWVYFANVSSTLDDRSVYLTRTRLGKELAQMETEKVNTNDYIVVPVPDTAKAASDSFAFTLGLQSMEGLIRNRYLGRTFIEGESRDEKVKNKFTPLKEILKGKKVLLVDDSVVRGTTLKKLISYIKEVGEAKEIHVRVSCPPIMGPCFYGIDMSTIAELFAPNHKGELKDGLLSKEVLKKMAEDVGADSLIYQSVAGLVRAIDLPEDTLCKACIDTKYPTPQGEKLYQVALTGKGKKNKRTYE